MATLWTAGTNIFTYQAGENERGLMQGPCKLPENLPKLSLGRDSYDFAMEMARALQVRHYNLDEWGKFKKLCMLSGLCRDSKDVRTHFLSGLDRKVHIMFTSHFPMWLENGNLDAGYVYVSELQETFNMVTHDIPQYTKFHQSMDEVISAKYGSTSTTRHGPANPAANTGHLGRNGDGHLPAASSTAAGTHSDSRRALGGRRDQCHWLRNDERRDRGLQHYHGRATSVNV
ncbi:hypothetical protein H4R20_000789 [Coemansia guatemalensis]|uniref:Uncharacterized protein n=1 Tax=Coemansia guatemalensis TaxID=2761395 RepID=A0A9W8I0H8_9FUNG|nr:hypothetical protein H4R20_000789 [Coemansia guatemalensis]